MQVFEGSQIIVIDNGSEYLNDKTLQACQSKSVLYLWCPIGSKLVALLVGSLIAETDYILQIDDDVWINKNMDLNITKELDCLGFTLSGGSHRNHPNFLQRFQDVEYKLSGMKKYTEGILGSTLFAHGAAVLWKREVLLKCIENHPAYPISDDWFLGYVAIKLGFRTQMSNSTFISTDVPSSFFGVMSSRNNIRKSGYGSMSLWNQRFGRWFRLTVIQALYTIRSIICFWNLPFLRCISIKVNQIWWLVTLVFTVMKYFYMGMIWKLDPLFGFLMSLLIASIFLLHLLIVNYCKLSKHERIKLPILLTFGFYTLYNNLCFALRLVLNVMVHLPWDLTIEQNKVLFRDDVQIYLAELQNDENETIITNVPRDLLRRNLKKNLSIYSDKSSRNLIPNNLKETSNFFSDESPRKIFKKVDISSNSPDKSSLELFWR